MCGMNCYCLLTTSERGQGGWEFSDLYRALYPNHEEAVVYRENHGILEGYDEKAPENFMQRKPWA